MHPNTRSPGSPVRLRAVRLIKLSQALRQERDTEDTLPPPVDITAQPTQRLTPLNALRHWTPLPLTPTLDVDMDDEDIDIETLNSGKLLHISGVLQAVTVQKQKTGTLSPLDTTGQEAQRYRNVTQSLTTFPPSAHTVQTDTHEHTQLQARGTSGWRTVLNYPAVKLLLGLAIGIGLLFFISRVVDIPKTLAILQSRLSTPQGIVLAFLCGLAFVAAYTIRGVRWKLFLNTIGDVSTLKAIQLFWVGVFFNFILPVRGGEVAKSLMLKRITGIPVSRSLPTVAMDKTLDLMPVLIVIALVPFLGVDMDIKIWLVLGAVGGILLGVIIFVALAIWKRAVAISLLQKLTGFLPKVIGSKIEEFAVGFIDSLLAGASQPKIFVPAVLLTILAVLCDGLYAMLAFWTVGAPLSFGTAIFGYTVYITFYILPTTPGEIGTNETVGLLVFSGLLHQSPLLVNAMFFFSHPFAALIMTTGGLLCLSGLGLTITGAMKAQKEGERIKSGKLPPEKLVRLIR